jgi:hypothetical protein
MARWVAELNADGADHDPWVGDNGDVRSEVEAFIATLRTGRRSAA